MGTLGCINDMLQRDKENRELRRRNRERLAETRNRLLEIGKETDYTNLSVKQLEDIRRKTQEKEALEKTARFKTMVCLSLVMALILLLVWLLVGCSGKPSKFVAGNHTTLMGDSICHLPNSYSEYLEYPEGIGKITELTKKEDSTSSQPTFMALQPKLRDIPLGKSVNPDSLSLNTEFVYYPLSATRVNVFIHNHSQRTYECGEKYSLVFYNDSLQQWDPLPVNPIINDVLWIIDPDCSSRLQTIELYTSETPNRPGCYRIYKTFNGSEVAYAEFKLVDRKGVKKLRRQVDDYWSKNRANPSDTVAYNIQTTWIEHDDGDTIFVGLMNNTPRFQEMFRRKVVSYSAVSHGKVAENIVFDEPFSSDTLQVSMQTEKAVYPVGTESITVQLTNGNPKGLFFGEEYWVVRKEGKQWIFLHDGSAWNSIGYGLEKGGTHTFTARLHPLVNDNRPGIYRVVKRIGFSGSRQKWYMAAEFRMK
ncbi:hypothetical protein EVA_11310 [gut metagenome]|uniref:Bacterial Ig-like domain-containing protein n=1 Tax=gut metagenome TaxID=749906 RepID=J9GFK2_9ZZZZ